MLVNKTMRDIYLLIHGQIRVPQVFIKNINLFIKLLQENVIKQVIVSTWIDEHPIEFKKHNHFTYIELPKLKDNGHGNWIAQMKNYEAGYKYIKSIAENPENTFILKGRPDAYMSEEFLKNVINKPLISKGPIFKHKIWIPWAEMIKPMYFGDELFFGHLEDMEKMYNFNDIYQHDLVGQGITHIRRYIDPFLEHYPIFKEYIENKNNLNVYILVVKDLQKLKTLTKEAYPYFIRLVRTYYEILDKYFDIDTKVGEITFRQWSCYPAEHRVNSEESLYDNNMRLCTVCKKMKCFGNDVLVGNKKCMYDNEYVKNVLNNKFDESDVIAKDIAKQD